jgi:DNA modification methylase
MSDVQGQNFGVGEYIGPGLAYPGNRLPTFTQSHDATGHTAAFPVGLPNFFCNAFTDADDIVFDPFLGSGSTLIAADQTKRIGIGCEISPAYVDVAITRWQNFTGERATLDGRAFDEIAAERRQEAA